MLNKGGNILFYEGGTGYGGSAFSLLDILKRITDQNGKPVLITVSDSEVFKDINKLGIKHIRFNNYLIDTAKKDIKKTKIKIIKTVFWNIFNAIYQIYRTISLIIEQEIGIIYLNNRAAPLSLIIAATMCNKKIICHMRGMHWWDLKHSFKAKILYKYVISRVCSVFICISESVKKHYHNLGIPENKLITIYNGIDLTKFKARKKNDKIKKKYMCDKNDFILAIISSIKERKGHEFLLHTMPKILEKYPNTKLLVVGSAITGEQAYEQKLKNYVKQNKLDKNVVFIPWTKNVPEILSIVDVLIQPSILPEGLGRTAIEAIASATPIIVTNAGGLAEVVDDKINGYLIEPGYEDGLQDRIQELIGNKDKAIQMGLQGRIKAERTFDKEKNVKKIVEIINQYGSIKNSRC